jgi:hypothetical protein
VPEASPIRIDLSVSRRAGRLRALALALTAAALAGCLWAVLRAPSPLRLGAALAAGATLALAMRPRAGGSVPAVGIDAEGAVVLQVGGSDEKAVVRYCSAHYVCLQGRAGLLPVWPDAAAGASWRRFLVACRWARRGDDGASARPTARRTK